MDELATKLVDSLTKVETALETMAPEAFGRLVEAAYATGMIALTQGFLLALAAIAGLAVLRMGIYKLTENGAPSAQEGIGGAMTVLGGVTAIVCGVGAMFTLFSTSVWFKVINPTAYVVKTLLAQ